MSFLKKIGSNIIWKLVGDRLDFSQEQTTEIRKRNEAYEKELVKQATPAPFTDYRETAYTASEVKLPRLPYNQFSFYFLRWQSTVLRAICLTIKQEVFRETRLKGLVWEPKFKLKCSKCQSEFQESMDQCEICDCQELVAPNPHQKKLLAPFELEANQAEQSFLSVLEETEDDLNTADDQFLVLLKDYFIAPNGEYFGKVREIMRGDPVRFRIVSDDSGRRGGLWWVCLFHRQGAYSQEGICDECQAPLAEVFYIESEAGGSDPVKFYVKGEVIHTSKYEPSRLYGISPIFSCWVLIRTIQLMDIFSEEIYEKGRLKGIIGVTTDNRTALKKWWDEVMARLRKDQHYVPVVAIDAGIDKGRGDIKFVKMMDSLKDMDFGPHKRMLKEEVSGLFGVNLIFMADTSSSGGLNNEGLQIMVTDRTVEWGQAVYHDEIFPRLLKELGITDWKLELQSSKEQDEMAELQREDLKINIAEKAIRLGYDVKLVDGKYEISGEAKRFDERTQDSFGSIPPSQTPLLPAGRPQKPVSPTDVGGKECPPGMISTPEKPRCHPISSEANKAVIEKADKHTELSVKMDKLYKLQVDKQKEKIGLEQKLRPLERKKIRLQRRHSRAERGEAQDKIQSELRDLEHEINDSKRDISNVDQKLKNIDQNINSLFRQRSQLTKSGDMMAHYSCLATKMKKQGFKHWPKNLNSQNKQEWLRKQSPEYQTAYKKNGEACTEASDNTSKHYGEDKEYPYPYPVKDKKKGYGPDPSAGSVNAGKRMKVFDMERVNDESGQSGTGLVLSGIVFPDGKVVIRWNTETASTTEFDSWEDFEAIHIGQHPGNETKIHFYKLNPGDMKDFAKAIEAGRKVGKEVQEVRNTFAKEVMAIFEKSLTDRLENLDDKSTSRLIKEVESIIMDSQPRVEKQAFTEVIQAYKKGKQIDVAKMAPPYATSGGKARMAKRLISILAKHDVFGEPFMGAASVTLKKEPAQKTYLNDMDKDLVLTMQTLQKGDPKEFQYLQKQDWRWSKQLFGKLKAQDPEQLQPLDRVYRKVYLRKQSFMGEEKQPRGDNKRTGYPNWLSSPEKFQKYSEKLKDVEITHGDFVDVIKRHDSPTTLHFIDPPYTDEFAKRLTQVLPTIKGKYLVTFLDNQILKDTFKEKAHQIGVTGLRNQGGISRPERKELLIANYPLNVSKDTIFKSKTELLKTIALPQTLTDTFEASFGAFGLDKADWQVLRAIYRVNPFWKAFTGMSRSISKKLNDIITESYEAPNSARFQATLRDVEREYPNISTPRAKSITYGRLGKFSLPRIIEKMQRTVNAEVYRLERIARTETTGITAKGREIAFSERDPQGLFKFDWFGPQDQRTSEICTKIKAQVRVLGKGDGVTIPMLKEVMQDVVEEETKGTKWKHREWIPHPNCRHVLRRTN